MLFAPVRAAAVFVLSLVTLAGYASDPIPTVSANDNRTLAGTLRDGVLTVDLVVQMTRWYPEAADGPFAEVVAFSESGKIPQVPGPLIRVPEGTVIQATVRNALSDSTVFMRDFGTRPSTREDSIAIRPGETKSIRFLAGAPGSYIYFATAGFHNPDSVEREQLAGALIVDPKGSRANDRVLVINIWGEQKDPSTYRNIVAVNGKSWPHTERLTANVGDTVRWRVLNASTRSHPMHLHGFYFKVTSRGSHLADTSLGPASRNVVTEEMSDRSTMAIEWKPSRPGNWLFHCHLTFHVNDEARLDAPTEGHDHTDPMNHMAGLVTGITVADPHRLSAKPLRASRKLRLYANERGDSATMRMSYVLQRDRHAPAQDSVEAPGSPIFLTRNETTEITVVNRTHASTAVHWHGIELESFSDGVFGWSGAGMKVAPMIAPKGSFKAVLALPRAGTFIYHTHLNDVEQLTAGAYGALIVLEPGEKFRPDRDFIFTLGVQRPAKPSGPVINGGKGPMTPLVLEVGRSYRFRFINISPARSATFAIRKDSLPVTWRPRAKDGADYPEAGRNEVPSNRRLSMGETFDADWTPARPGTYALTVGSRTVWFYNRAVIVRE
jgi:FtsP/CotA-like multicopper oxidase with cupredoxin domain